MGLAEPRKRIKIAHDPRNLSWSQSSDSFAQRLMSKHGWKEGQSLGNRDSTHVGLSDADRLAAARVGVLFKDDNLGLGAKRKSRDVEAQRTGLDAFQGLLGRLNGKSDVELKEQEKKVEDRKLEMYVRGRWGGMVFVRGGVLVGDREDEEKTKAAGKDGEGETSVDDTNAGARRQDEPVDTEKQRRKEEKRKRREEKALRKAAKKAKREAKQSNDSNSNSNSDADGHKHGETLPVHSHRSPLTQAPDEPVSSVSSASETESRQKRKRRRSSVTSNSQSQDAQRQKSNSSESNLQQQKPAAAVKPTAARLNLNLKNGRHLLRGRNIQAKKMVFSDMKGLDEIFMRPG